MYLIYHHSFVFSMHFIMVSVQVGPEPIVETMGVRQDQRCNLV